MKQRAKGLDKFVCYAEVSLYQGSFIYNYFTITRVRKS